VLYSVRIITATASLEGTPGGFGILARSLWFLMPAVENDTVHDRLKAVTSLDNTDRTHAMR